jgi:hypothetical protein
MVEPLYRVPSVSFPFFSCPGHVGNAGQEMIFYLCNFHTRAVVSKLPEINRPAFLS